MSLAVCVFLTWCIIITFSLMPKKLSELDMVFLFFINTILDLSLFTIVHLNLHWIVVSKSVEKSFADLVLRLITIPLVLLIASNLLLYSWKYLKWVIVLVIVLMFIPMQWLLERMGVITTPHWNALYTFVMFSAYVLFSRLAAWFILRIARKEVKAG